MHAQRIAFLASSAGDASQIRARLVSRYGEYAIDQADVLCALGGDGFLLQTLHRHSHALAKPVFGMKLGSVGFLMNQFREDHLAKRIARSEPVVLQPLRMIVHTESGVTATALAYNEVSLLRQTRQAAHLAIELNGKLRVDELIADGVMVATPAGSTAYNYSAYGPILPLRSRTLALTPIAPYRPRRWRGAILQANTQVRLQILDPYKRPVSVTADSHEIRNVVEVTVDESPAHQVTLLFDPEHNLEERIFDEQFIV